MSRTGLKKMLVLGVALVGLSLCAAQADAGWWWGAAPSCYGSCYSGCYGGCYSGGNCCSSIAYVPTCGCYTGCSGCGHRACHRGCGYGCGWSCGCDTCWTSVSCCGTCGGTYWGSPVVSSCGCGTVVSGAVEGPSMPAPAAPTPALAPSKADVAPAPDKPAMPVDKPAMPADKPAAPAPGIPGTALPVPDAPGLVPPVPNKTSIEPTAEESGLLTVWAPYDAKVTINGLLTKSTGSKRHFVSYGLRAGYSYKYNVKAEVVREGKIVTEEQTVSLTAGGQNGVAFGFNNPPSSEGLAQSE